MAASPAGWLHHHDNELMEGLLGRGRTASTKRALLLSRRGGAAPGLELQILAFGRVCLPIHQSCLASGALTECHVPATPKNALFSTWSSCPLFQLEVMFRCCRAGPRALPDSGELDFIGLGFITLGASTKGIHIRDSVEQVHDAFRKRLL